MTFHRAASHFRGSNAASDRHSRGFFLLVVGVDCPLLVERRRRLNKHAGLQAASSPSGRKGMSSAGRIYARGGQEFIRQSQSLMIV